MSESAMVALGADLKDFRKQLGEATKLLEKALDAKSVRPLNKELSVTDKAMKNLHGSLNLVKVGFAAIGLGRLVREMKEFGSAAVGAARDFQDAFEGIRIAAERGQGAFAPDKMRGFLGDLSIGKGQRLTGLTETAAEFRRSFGDRETMELTALAADIAAQRKVGLEQASKIVRDATLGKTEGLEQLGIGVDRTGNRAKDAEAALSALQGQFRGTAARLVNPNDRLDVVLDQIRIAMGEELQPGVDKLIERGVKVLEGWQATDMTKHIQVMRELLAGALGGAAGLVDVAGAAKPFLTRNWFTVMARPKESGEAFAKGGAQLFEYWRTGKIEGGISDRVSRTLEKYEAVGDVAAAGREARQAGVLGEPLAAGSLVNQAAIDREERLAAKASAGKQRSVRNQFSVPQESLRPGIFLTVKTRGGDPLAKGRPSGNVSRRVR